MEDGEPSKILHYSAEESGRIYVRIHVKLPKGEKIYEEGRTTHTLRQLPTIRMTRVSRRVEKRQSVGSRYNSFVSSIVRKINKTIFSLIAKPDDSLIEKSMYRSIVALLLLPSTHLLDKERKGKISSKVRLRKSHALLKNVLTIL